MDNFLNMLYRASVKGFEIYKSFAVYHITTFKYLLALFSLPTH